MKIFLFGIGLGLLLIIIGLYTVVAPADHRAIQKEKARLSYVNKMGWNH